MQTNEISERRYSIYRHTFPNGKIYIGITSQKPHERWASGKGYSKQPLMHNAIEKYGWDNVKHDILSMELTCEEACGMERNIISSTGCNNREVGYNIENGGIDADRVAPETVEKQRATSTGRRHSAETKRLISEKAKGRPSPMKGRSLSENAKTKLRQSHLGLKHSEETKRKMSEERCGGLNAMHGKRHSARAKDLISESQRRNFIPVMCVESGERFESIRDASVKLGADYSNVKFARDKPNLTVKGYHIITDNKGEN